MCHIFEGFSREWSGVMTKSCTTKPPLLTQAHTLCSAHSQAHGLTHSPAQRAHAIALFCVFGHNTQLDSRNFYVDT